MTRQLTIPPPHVWDRIEKILDEQDQARKDTDKLITDTFHRARNARRLNLLFAFVTGISLMTFVVWNYTGGLKQS